MSKRTGKAITLTDLLEEIPIDAARFFFNMREPNSTTGLRPGPGCGRDPARTRFTMFSTPTPGSAAS